MDDSAIEIRFKMMSKVHNRTMCPPFLSLYSPYYSIFDTLRLMSCSRILCLDLGQKRTGVAASDETRTLASPVQVLESHNRKKLIGDIQVMIKKLEIGSIVVGMPLDQNGEVGQDAAKVKQFIAVLRERVEVPVLEWDERYSTVEAEQRLIEADYSRERRRGMIDMVAATIILQSYLDHLKKE